MAVVEDVLLTRLSLAGLSAFTTGMGAAGRGVQAFGRDLDETHQHMLKLGGAVGIVGLLTSGIMATARAAGELEQVRIGFTTILGSADAAEKKIRELQEFAVRTPFDFKETVRGSQQLLAMGVRSEKLIPILTAVGDAVSATGGDTAKFARVLDIIGRVEAQGRLMGREVMRLGLNGIPAFKALGAELGLTADQMRQIGKQGVDGEKAIDALMRIFTRMFGGQMSKMATSFVTSMSNLHDATFQLAAVVGERFAPAIGAAARFAQRLVLFIKDAPGAATLLATVMGVGVVGGLIVATREAVLLRNALIQGAGAAITIAGAMSATGGKGAAGAVGRVAVGSLAPFQSGFAAAQAAKNPGLLARMGGAPALLRGGAGILAGTAISEGGAALFGGETAGGRFGSALSVLGGRTLTGAMIGSGFGGPAGAVVGGIAGLIEGGIESWVRFRPPATSEGSPAEQYAKRTAEATEKTAANIDAILKAPNIAGPPGSEHLIAGSQMLRIMARSL